MKVKISNPNYMIFFFFNFCSILPLNTQLNIPYVFHPASKSSPNPTL